MDLIMNFSMAWLSVLFGGFLIAKYVLRKLAPKSAFFKKLNRMMKIPHIVIGILLIISGFVHGLFSSMKVFSINYGTLLWLITILLGVNYFIRSKLKAICGWLNVHRVLSVLYCTILVVHIVNVGGIQVINLIKDRWNAGTDTQSSVSRPENPQISGSETESMLAGGNSMISDSGANSAAIDNVNQNLFGVTLKNGTYTGVADAYGKGLTVEVVIDNNVVTSIEIVKHNERNSRYYSKAFNKVPGEIIDTQSLDVDIVAGATYSSIGIMNAVNNALSQAVISGELPELLPLKRGR